MMCLLQTDLQMKQQSGGQVQVPLFAPHAELAVGAGCGAFAVDSCGPQALAPVGPLSRLGDPS